MSTAAGATLRDSSSQEKPCFGGSLV